MGKKHAEHPSANVIPAFTAFEIYSTAPVAKSILNVIFGKIYNLMKSSDGKTYVRIQFSIILLIYYSSYCFYSNFSQTV